MGNFPLRGPDQGAWSWENTYDLLAVSRRESSDPFSRWLTDTFLPFFHNILGKRFRKPLSEDPESEICQYSETSLSNAVNVLGTVLASVLPITSIVALYFVTNTLVRLEMSVAFTALFSCCLAVMSGAKRVEIFAASSAYVGQSWIICGDKANMRTALLRFKSFLSLEAISLSPALELKISGYA
jgi:hypothetical protein